ncbi:MAG: DUF1844 domain-containing protein [Myxococcota bacterium]
MSDSDPNKAGFTVQDAGEEGELPKIDFSTFVLSLATSAMVHLGQAPNPDGSEPPPPNLPLAQHTIDTLEMMQAKTQGNLSDEEAKLLQSVLYELRMGFVRAKG